MASAVLLYDDDCGLCRWTLGKVLAWDRNERIRPVAIDSNEGASLLAVLSEEQRGRSWHLVVAGKRYSAGEAFPPLFRLLPGAGPLARLADGVPRLTNRAYFLVANNRSRLGSLITEGAKRRADARIAERSREEVAA